MLKLTDERLDTAVYVLVLLKSRGCGKGLATFRAGMGSGTDMLRTDVALEVARVCEHLRTETIITNLCQVYSGENNYLSPADFVSLPVYKEIKHL